ncbi:MAG TPA: hypothetical protein VHZ02_07415 [Acidimicrobiales bacterium]|nr:hypothetical protein [Acidimicrobiales bacterium]
MDHAGELWGDDGQPGDDVGEPGDHVVEEPGEDVEELVEGDPPGDLASGE